MCEKYNGWTNYETWAVKLWIDNDEGLQSMVEEMADEHKEGDDPIGDLKDAIEAMVWEFYEEQVKDDMWGLFKDMITSSIQTCNFYEISENVLEDME